MGDGKLPTRVSGVVFDIDGVLVDSESGYDEATCAALIAVGFLPNPRIRMSMVGLPLSACELPLTEEYGESFPWHDFVVSYRQHARTLPPVPKLQEGVSDGVRRLRMSGIKIGFATNATDESARTVLLTHALIAEGDVLVTRNDVQYRKPDPDVYVIAATRLNSPPQSLVAVEDSLVGLTAAKRAGMFAALIPDFAPPPSEWHDQADGTFTSVTELVDLLLA